MPPGSLNFVEQTAQIVASYRVVDSLRTDQPPLVHEPLLHELLGDSPEVQKLLSGVLAEYRKQERERGQAHVAPFTSGRLRFGDEALMAALAGMGQTAQVVILGAGLDTRAWRLPFERPDTYRPSGAPPAPPPPAGTAKKHVTVFEVDQAEMTAFKAARVKAGGAQTECSNGKEHRFPLNASRWLSVAADFREEGWAQHLKAAGFQPGTPTVWVAEGLHYYLPPAVGERLLRDLAGLSAPGSALVFSSVNPALIRAVQMALADPAYPLDEETRSFYRSWVSCIEDNPADFFKALGWDLLVQKDWDQVAKEYAYSLYHSETERRLVDTFTPKCGPLNYYHCFAKLR